MDKVLLVIPAFNEEKNIERVVEDLVRGFPYLDYVVVNDGSRDSTAKICREKGYNLLDLPVNLGLAGCFQAGMKYAYRKGYRYAIQFDGDGQHRPEYIEAMRQKMEEGYDIVIGSRFVTEKKGMVGQDDWEQGHRQRHPAHHRHQGDGSTSGMRMFNRKMIEEFALNLNYGPEPDTVSFLIKQGARVAELQVTIDERLEGESYLKPLTAIHYMARMLISILMIQNFRKR